MAGMARRITLETHRALRGLAAMTEADSDFFFGRGRETVEVIKALEGRPTSFPSCSAIQASANPLSHRPFLEGRFHAPEFRPTSRSKRLATPRTSTNGRSRAGDDIYAWMEKRHDGR